MIAMHPLRLDYQRSNKPVPWLGAGVLLLTMAVLAVMGGQVIALNKQVAAWEKKAERYERLSSYHALAARPLAKQAERAQLLEVKQANEVVRQLSLPWNTLFTAVEASGGKDIALLAMEPDMHEGTVKISGEAKDLNALLDYVRQLSKREVFSSVFLQSHQVRQDDPERPLRFSLLVYWKGVLS
jgi:hypothetical protein